MKRYIYWYNRLLILFFAFFFISMICLSMRTSYAQTRNAVETQGKEEPQGVAESQGKEEPQGVGELQGKVESQGVGELQGTAESQETAKIQNSPHENPSGPTLHAQSAVLLDADTGRVLYGKEEDLIRPMASTTKIMTCILALERGNQDDPVTVSANAAGQPKVHLGAPAGRTFYLKDLLYSLMLESHNDSAVMIAEHLGGSTEGFARLMNEKARQLGCSHPHFITPNGLDASVTAKDGKTLTHSTTARDLAAIMRYCTWQSPQKEKFLEITRTQNYYFMDVEGKSSYSCVNHNAFLSMESGALSGKTGFTGGAGYSYVAAVEDGDRHFTLALLGCGWPPHKTYKWSDAKALFSYGKENYEKREVYREPELCPIPVNHGIPQDGDISHPAYVSLTLNISQEDKTLKVLMRDGEEVQVQVVLPESLEAPVGQGTAIGKVVYSLDGMPIKTYPVYAEESTKRLSLSWCMKRIASLFLFL